ncbi:MAG: 30S ribosomal protein S8 [Bdellovibrionales bacterium]|nr:30S ribosomal protein S8 [Bdellovibrionales bacterium]
MADFITRIRNAQNAKHEKVDIPASNVRKGIADVLKETGFIRDYRVAADGRQGVMRVYLKYTNEGKPLISEIKRVSRPGLRRYCASDSIPKVRSGFGVTILSTNKGILSDESARKENVGGEILINVW